MDRGDGFHEQLCCSEIGEELVPQVCPKCAPLAWAQKFFSYPIFQDLFAAHKTSKEGLDKVTGSLFTFKRF